MSCFVDFVTFCSRLVGSGQDEPGDSVNEHDLMESDLGTEVNEDNEEESYSLSICGESATRCAIISRPNNLLQSGFCPPEQLAVTER
jgi:hypothetical protein